MMTNMAVRLVFIYLEIIRSAVRHMAAVVRCTNIWIKTERDKDLRRCRTRMT